MNAIPLALLALCSPFAAAQDPKERLEPPTEAEWRELQGRQPLAAPASAEPSMQVYDVRDLLEAALGPMPSHLEAGLGPEEERLAIEGREQSLREQAARLAELLRAFLEPPLADDEQLTDVTPGGFLLARLRPAQHRCVQEVLQGLRAQPNHYSVETRFIEAPRGAFREHLPPGTASFLEDAEARARFLALVDQEGFDYGIAPEVLLRGAQQATLAVMEEVPYVAKYELVVVQPSGQEIADPVIEVLEEGYSLDMRVLPLPGEQLGLELALTRAWIERPIPTRKIRLSAAIDTEVEVAAPVSHRTDVRSRLLLSPGSSVVFLTPSNDEGRDLAVVVSAKPMVLTGSAR